MGELARIAYEAYAEKSRELHGGDVAGWPSWDCMTVEGAAAWSAAALAVCCRCEHPGDSTPETPGDGQWMRIAFMGHVELTGYVTEITIGGQAAFHVDLPEKLWGDNLMAWREYAATALYSREPVTEESVRKRWESQRAARLAWEERERRYELEAADDDSGDDDDAEPF